MRALVVYESMFGNTASIAKAIRDGISDHLETDLVEVGGASPQVGDETILLVIGGPTHAMGLSSAQTRHTAQTKAPTSVISARIGIREWITELVVDSARTTFATFDTRTKHHWVPGSAAVKADKALRRLGLSSTGAPTSFLVNGTPGPLLPGELARAREWGALLGAASVSHQGAHR